MVSISIKRVISVFIIRPSPNGQQPTKHLDELALFHRCASMPTFANHWAGISGSIETSDSTPMDAAVRELEEETNLLDLFALYNMQHRDKHKHHGDGRRSDRSDTKHIDIDIKSCIKQGLHVDVSTAQSKGAFDGRIIRVYPFSLMLPTSSYTATATTSCDRSEDRMWSKLEMKGTEHDYMKFMPIDKFLQMDEPCVPSLKLAFHHATCGSYLKLPKEVRLWEQDRTNGAAHLARSAVILAAAAAATNTADNTCQDETYEQPNLPLSIAMLRPSMVPIVNVMQEYDRRIQSTTNQAEKDRVKDDLLHSLDEEIGKCVDLGVETIVRYYNQRQVKKKKKKNSSSLSTSERFTIGTFSRSSTMKNILLRVIQETSKQEDQQSSSSAVAEEEARINIICSQSTPGDEGELMASDIPNEIAQCLPDIAFQQYIQEGKIDIVLIGADCILQSQKEEGGINATTSSSISGVVNKVGTSTLATVCEQSNVPMICCADRYKLWKDGYPPALEDIFELVHSKQLLVDHILVPSFYIGGG